MSFFSGNPTSFAQPVRLGSVPLDVDGRRVEFTFPESGNMRALVTKVLAGQEYPILRLPGYAPAIVVDVGANVGASALFFHRAFPQARVYCFEPSPTNLAFLRPNAAHAPAVQVFGYGLHDRAADVKLFVGRTQSMQNSLLKSIETGDTFEAARVEPARAEFERLGLAGAGAGAAAGGVLLKLDTEGCEVPILTDLRPALGAVDLLYVEYHSEEDRRAIDAIAADGMTLAVAHALMPHRGMNVYVARRLAERFPMLDAARIVRS